MITGLRMMNRLRNCSKQLQHAKVLLGAITIAEVSYYSKNPTEMNATVIEMNQAHSWGMGLIENIKAYLLLAYKHAAGVGGIATVEREQEI